MYNILLTAQNWKTNNISWTQGGSEGVVDVKFLVMKSFSPIFSFRLTLEITKGKYIFMLMVTWLFIFLSSLRNFNDLYTHFYGTQCHFQILYF